MSEQHGPMVVISYTCDGCVYLGVDRTYSRYSCSAPEIMDKHGVAQKHSQDRTTPPWCPYRPGSGEG